MDRFIVIARRTDGEFVIRAPHDSTTQEEEIADAEFIFNVVNFIETVRLYRVDPGTAEPVHVQTWTRNPELAETV
jgi:hypothetical protein